MFARATGHGHPNILRPFPDGYKRLIIALVDPVGPGEHSSLGTFAQHTEADAGGIEEK